MQIDVVSPILQTIFVGIVLVAVLLFSSRKKQSSELIPLQTTQELKGFALLAILFGHIAYALLKHQSFLFPFSVFAGVGVDLFLFLSGFGLATSAFQKPLTLKEFYKKRLTKIFFSLWSILVIFLILDFFFLKRTYPLQEIVLSFFGIFPRADLTQNINSPLWYITLILFYYILFPIVFHKSRPIVSAVGLYVIGWLFLQLPLPVDPAVKNLYELHTVAFALGVACIGVLPHVAKVISQKKNIFIQVGVLLSTVFLFYFGIHSGVGKGIFWEQSMSLLLLFFTLFIFLFKKFEFRFLTLFGLYSHEIYLLHWPLLSRYDVFYNLLPAGFATLVWCAVLVLLGDGFQRINDFVQKKHSS